MAEEETPCIKDKILDLVTNILSTRGLIILYFVLIMITFISFKIEGHTFLPMDIFNLYFGVVTLFFLYKQILINESLFKMEKERNNPRLIANVPSSGPLIFIENQGGGMAWGCEVTAERMDLEGHFEEFIEKIYPWSGEQFNIPEEWYNDTFDLYIGIEYYTEEDMNSDSLRKWARIFKKINPYMF